MHPLAVVLSLAVAAGEPASAASAAGPDAEAPPAQGDAAPGARPESPPAAPESAPPAVAAGTEPPPAQPPSRLRGWRQDLGLGSQSTTFWSVSHHHYTIHSLGLSYLASIGRRGVFLHATALLPVQGREDGRVYGLGQYYAARYGGDLLTGFQWRWRMPHDAEGEAGAGPHAAFVVLRGLTGYSDFSASPMGLGAEALLRWRTGGALAHRPVTFAVFGSAALDFYDPFHGKDLRRGYTFRLGVSLGLAPRGA